MTSLCLAANLRELLQRDGRVEVAALDDGGGGRRVDGSAADGVMHRLCRRGRAHASLERGLFLLKPAQLLVAAHQLSTGVQALPPLANRSARAPVRKRQKGR